MKIGEAAKECGLPVKTVRFYADIGLICPSRRSNRYREFDADTVQKLGILRSARCLDFSLAECQTILEIAEKPRKNREISGPEIERLLEKLSDRRDDIEQLEKLLVSQKR